MKPRLHARIGAYRTQNRIYTPKLLKLDLTTDAAYLYIIRTKCICLWTSVCGHRLWTPGGPCNALATLFWTFVYTVRPVLDSLEASHGRHPATHACVQQITTATTPLVGWAAGRWTRIGRTRRSAGEDWSAEPPP